MNEKIKQKINLLPSSPGSYQMLDRAGNIIYVGKAVNLKNRVSSYFVNSSSHNEKTRNLVSHIDDFTYIVTPTELDALCLEANLIKKHQPYYNILLKDGKAFAYIKINTKVDYPKIEVVRKVKNDGCKYFGPYFNGVSYKEIIDLISYAFNLRTCNFSFCEEKPLKRACLNHDIGLCYAPCVNKVSKEEYKQRVNETVDFLNGNTSKIKQLLTTKMLDFSSKENFETALIYRNLLTTLSKLDNKVHTQLSTLFDCDAVGFSTNGVYSCINISVIKNGKILGMENFILNSVVDGNEDAIVDFLTQYYENKIVPNILLVPFKLNNEELLEKYFLTQKESNIDIITPMRGDKKTIIDIANKNAEEFLAKNIEKEKLMQLQTTGAISQLQQLLSLKDIPVRIEGYDISNLGATNKVASMVVFINGKAEKSNYRKFKLDEVEGQNDFECLKEVLKRRVAEFNKQKDLSFSKKPDLIVIDGGKGQLSSAVEILSNFDCEVISLAKQLEEVYVPTSNLPIILSRNSYALKLLQRVRDESHRFAITFHRQRRTKQLTSVSLTNIQNIGKTKRDNLISHFKSFEKIKNASIYELMQVSRISKTDATNIYNHFHNE